MQKEFIFVASILLFIPFGISHAQTSCLVYPSNASAPSGFGVSWDVTTPEKELLVKSNCPGSGSSIDLTVGKGNTSQYIWSKTYVYNAAATPPAWEMHTLAGTTDANGWVTSGSGTKIITTPFTPSASNPLYFVGYVCTFHDSKWKCGCSNVSCTSKHWQLQAYKGNGGGMGGTKLKDISQSDKAVCMFDSAAGSRFSPGAKLYGLRDVKDYLTPITYAPPGQMTTYQDGDRFLYDHSDAGIESGAQKLAARAIWGWEEAAEKSKLVWVDFESFDSVNVPASVGYDRSTDGELGALYDIRARQALRTESVRLRSRIVARAAEILANRGYRDFEFVDYNAPRKLIYTDRNFTASNPLVQAEVSDLRPYLQILSGTGPQAQLILGANVLEGLSDGSISWQSIIDWQVASVSTRIQAHGVNGRVAPAIWPILHLSGAQPSRWPTNDHLVPSGFMNDLFNDLYDAGVRRFVFWTPWPDGTSAEWRATWDARWAELALSIRQKCQQMTW